MCRNFSFSKAKNVGNAEHRRGFFNAEEGKKIKQKNVTLLLFHSLVLEDMIISLQDHSMMQNE
jgi:hypothetical protein